MLILGIISASIARAYSSIIEYFNRSDSATLGTSPGGLPWNEVRSSWGIVSNKANSSTAASSYPLATLTFADQDVSIAVDNIGPGVGTAFWVTDSGNWWATYLDGTQSCQTCYNTSNCSAYGTCYNPSNCSSYGTCATPGNCSSNGTCYNPSNCASNGTCYNPSNCTSYNPFSFYYCVNAYFCPDPSVCSYCGNCASSSPGNAYICCTSQNSPTPYTCCTGYNPTNYYTCCTGYNASNPYSCCNSYNASNPYSCNCTVNHSIKLIKSIASAISTVYTFTLGATAVGIKTILSGNTVTVAGYSATGLSTQIGSNQNTTISGQTKTNFHGIIKAPVTYSTVQTSDIDEFRVN